MRSIVIALILTFTTLAHAELKTERVILVTVDGLRHNEIFGGLDPVLMEKPARVGVKDPDKLREKYWRATPKDRREALFPFFWGTLAKEGVILGNPRLNSRVKVTNAQRVSYPGYSEILTGAPDESLRGNQPVRNPNTTVLEFIMKSKNLKNTDVAAFCSWEIFNYIVSKEADAFVCNAGYEAMDPSLMTPGMEALNAAQFEMLTPWDSVRFDHVTFTFAMEYLKEYEPPVMYIALGETDDWAHDNRYDRVIEAAHFFDESLETLWNTIQSMDAYRGKTTIIVTTDHGRGDNARTWTDHNPVLPTAIDIWAAVFGPDTPNRGELSGAGTRTQAQIAATLAAFMGLDWPAEYDRAAPPIPEAFESGE